jgi:hypothetical protein
MADEPKKLGVGDPGTLPLTSTDSVALIVTLPALPVATVAELTAPPSRSTNLDVLIVTFPASPSFKEGAVKVLGLKMLVSPISSTDSVAFTIKSPPPPVPKVGDDIEPPSRAVNRPVDTVTSPPSPELKATAEITLSKAGLMGENPINCTESEAFTLTSPALAELKE